MIEVFTLNSGVKVAKTGWYESTDTFPVCSHRHNAYRRLFNLLRSFNVNISAIE